MEETNFPRQSILGTHMAQESSTVSSKHTSSDAKETSETGNSPSREENGTVAWTGHRKTYLDKIKIFQSADLHKRNELRGMVSRPLIFLTFPVIFYSGFSYGSNLVWFNVLNATASLILSSPPYNFRASMVGLSYVSPLIGVGLGAIYTGFIGDKFVLAKARRNRGVLESEHRLWLFAPSLLLIPGGLILWGVGAAHHVHWFGCVFAMGIIALTNVIGLSLSVSYAIDSYKDLSGEAVVTVILVRNTMSFAIGYG
jgi:hypothetical protein